MDEELEVKTGFDRDRYWNGVFTGVFIGCFFISALLLLAVRFQGLKVSIDPDRLARMVQDRVQTEARKSLPQVLEGIKKELPGQISGNLTELDGLQITIGKTPVALPEEAVAAIKGEFNRIIEEGVINTLNGYDTKIYEEKLGQNTYELIQTILREEVIGKTYVVKASEWLTVPVKIVGSSKLPARVDI